MRLVEFNWHPTNRQLRQFGVICLFALPFVAWLWSGSPRTVVALGVLGVVLASLGIIMPVIVKPVFLAMMLVATPIGIVLSELSMLFIYYGVFVPIGLVFRLMRRDGLQIKLNRSAKSYWQPVEKPTNVASYYRQS